MVIGSSVDMLSEMGMRPVSGGSGGGGDGFGGDDLGKEIDLLLREQRRQEASDRERELNIYRSGSAPPSVEGSLGLFGGSSAAFADFGRNGNGFMSEEELRSDPAYVDYYYSHVNLNPRLPPPVLSKEDWRFAQRLQGGSSVLGGIGDRRKANRAEEGGSRSLLRSNLQNEGDMEQRTGEWLNRGGDGLIGLSGLALGNRQKSLADIFQADNIGRSVPASGHPSRPASRNAFDESLETFDTAETQLAHLNRDISSVDGQMTGGSGQSAASVQPIGPSASHTFASVLGSSLSRSNTPDPQMVARAPSPGLPPVGVRIGATDKKTNNSSSHLNGVPSSLPESADILSSFSAMNLSRNLVDDEDSFQSKLQEVKDAQSYLFDAQGGKNNVKQHSYMKRTDTRHSNAIPHLMRSSYSDLGKNSGLMDLSNSSLMPEGQVDIPIAPTNSYLKAPSVTSMSSPGGSPSHYLSSDSAHYLSSDSAHAAFTGIGLGAYASNSPVQSMMANHIGTGNVPPLFENAAAASFLTPGLDSRALGGFSAGFNAVELQNLNRIANHAAATGLQMPPMDPLYLQYLRTAEYAAQFGPNLNNPSLDGTFAGNAYVDLLGLQKAYLGTLLPSQNQYNLPYLGKSGSLNHSYYGNPSFGLGMTYPGSPLMSPARTSPSGPGSPLRHGDRNMRFPSAMRNLSGGGMGSWNLDAVGNIDDTFGSSLLEEFKSNKTKCLELFEIAGHVVEFSADQYGSRFIQQKLETATIEEKNMVFEEIMPQALSLMTDVFGNYVIQKFFEHGTATQTRELANKLSGHVLTLSLQMYGCRVIQKAIEVVDLDQQTKMVAELDGHVMRCVRDQNGNHVIQKCIECIPQDAIQFIISSFYDQVVTLSTHPYGCRVIQRVLEHCDDPKTQQIVMDEIMQCVCMLAQDQYGNYVVQHVLEHGKPHERSAIIKQLAGQIVQMSQQKFASNVVEKCLSFGGPEERQLLVNEMLGSTDENEPLQAMMKDQFANYVVQKVLETCNDNQRELILSRIKVHLNALKKYTYGKHIVARVEKLVAAGERRIGVQSQYPS